MFTGDDAASRAQERYDALKKEGVGDGELDLDTFVSYVLAYSDEEGIEETNGSYAWSGSAMNDEIKEVLEYMGVGDYSQEAISDDDAVEIIFCDEEYAFASSDEITDVPDDVPDELMEEIEEAVVETAWSSACDSYLAVLLSNAKITYYPVPDDASYNVDMALAES